VLHRTTGKVELTEAGQTYGRRGPRSVDKAKPAHKQLGELGPVHNDAEQNQAPQLNPSDALTTWPLFAGKSLEANDRIGSSPPRHD
jgi:DNA-binding transcriptional LysR family regulator